MTPSDPLRLPRSLAVLAALCSGMLALYSVPPVKAQDGSVPDRPTGLTATTVTHNAVTVTWDDPGDDSITHYQILRRDRAIHAAGELVPIDDNTGSAATRTYLKIEIA